MLCSKVTSSHESLEPSKTFQFQDSVLSLPVSAPMSDETRAILEASSSSFSQHLARNFTSSSPQCTFYEWSRQPHQAGFLRIFSTISVLTVLVVLVVLGNALVIAAVLLRRRLRSATGLLILSLGFADLLVSSRCPVNPSSIPYQTCRCNRNHHPFHQNRKFI